MNTIPSPRDRLLSSTLPKSRKHESIQEVQSKNLNKKAKQTMHELWTQLREQVEHSEAARDHLEQSSKMLQKTFTSYSSIQSVLYNSSRLFRKIQRSVHFYKWIFYICLFIYLVVCGIVITRRVTPKFIISCVQSLWNHVTETLVSQKEYPATHSKPRIIEIDDQNDSVHVEL